MTLLFAVTIVACAPPQAEPRSVLDFMDDGLAREGVLTRCNRNRDATLTDDECANARRAATAVALEGERAGAGALALESERKLLALRQRTERETAAEQGAAAQVRAAAEAAYEAQWRDPAGRRPAGSAPESPAPAFGAPMGPRLPSLAESTLFDVYAEGAEPLGRRELEIAAAEPPANEVPIVAPELELAELATLPRPFRSDSESQ